MQNRHSGIRKSHCGILRPDLRKRNRHSVAPNQVSGMIPPPSVDENFINWMTFLGSGKQKKLMGLA
jgi:hypothetical protein